jgi:hypothetical protein
LKKLSKENNTQMGFFKEFKIIFGKNLYQFATDYKKLIVIMMLYILITSMIMAIFWNLGSIQENPIAAFTSRAGFILMT